MCCVFTDLQTKGPVSFDFLLYQNSIGYMALHFKPQDYWTEEELFSVMRYESGYFCKPWEICIPHSQEMKNYWKNRGPKNQSMS